MERPSNQVLAFASGYFHQYGGESSMRIARLLAVEAQTHLEDDLFPDVRAPSAVERVWAAEALRVRAEERPELASMLLSVAAWLAEPPL